MKVKVKSIVTLGPNVLAVPGQELTDAEFVKKLVDIGVEEGDAQGIVQRLVQNGTLEAEDVKEAKEPEATPEDANSTQDEGVVVNRPKRGRKPKGA